MSFKVVRFNKNNKMLCICGKKLLFKNYKRHTLSRLHQMYLVL